MLGFSKKRFRAPNPTIAKNEMSFETSPKISDGNQIFVA